MTGCFSVPLRLPVRTLSSRQSSDSGGVSCADMTTRAAERSKKDIPSPSMIWLTKLPYRVRGWRHSGPNSRVSREVAPHCTGGPGGLQRWAEA